MSIDRIKSMRRAAETAGNPESRRHFQRQHQAAIKQWRLTHSLERVK